MNKELQDLLWQCLPKEARQEIKERYEGWNRAIGFGIECILYNDLFGSHNLTSDTEPSEYICVEKDLVLAHYDRAQRLKKDEDARWEFVGRQIEHTLLRK